MTIISHQANTLKLRSASNPEKYTRLLKEINQSSQGLTEYQAGFALEGLIAHLSYRTEIQAPPPGWVPANPLPNLVELARFVLECFQIYPFFQADMFRLALALNACAQVLESPEDTKHLAACQIRLASHHDPELFSEHQENAPSLHAVAQRSVRGKTAESVLRLTAALLQKNLPLPDLILPVLFRFATDRHPGVRAALLDHLSLLTPYEPDLAWRVHQVAMHPLNINIQLWPHSEKFLQNQCIENFQKVVPCLAPKKRGMYKPNINIWADTLANAFLNSSLSTSLLNRACQDLSGELLWLELFKCFQHTVLEVSSAKKSLTALKSLISAMSFTKASIEAVRSALNFFDENENVSLQLADTFIFAVSNTQNSPNLSWFYDWLFSLSKRVPMASIQLCEHLLAKAETCSISQREKFLEVMTAVLRQTKHVQASDLMDRALALKKENI